MATLKEFEQALQEYGMRTALAILEMLRERDRKQRSIAAPRRVRGTKMTPELAQRILEMHKSTEMTQQEIAFKLGVNQGRVNEVVKRGKWLTEAPERPVRAAKRDTVSRTSPLRQRGQTSRPRAETRTRRGPNEPGQLSLTDL